jgi:hypothetical protein
MSTEVQIEWNKLQPTTKGLFYSPYNSPLCNTPFESKKVDLQLSPSPQPAVPVPEIPDTGSIPQASNGDGVLVRFMGNNNYHDVALQAASELLPPDEEEDVVKKKNKNKNKNKNRNRRRNRKKKKDEEATRKEEYKNEEKDEVVTMAQVNRQGWRNATANIDHNTPSEFHALEEFPKKPNPGLPASTALVKSSFETSQDTLVLSTYQLHICQEFILSPIEKEQMAVYQRAIEGIGDRNGRHVIILTTLPNMDQWTISAIQVVNEYLHSDHGTRMKWSSRMKR